MIIHADMPGFGQYRVILNRAEVTPQIYMADDKNGVVITRHWASYAGGFVYERITGQVVIYRAKTAQKKRSTVFGKQPRVAILFNHR